MTHPYAAFIAGLLLGVVIGMLIVIAILHAAESN